MLKKINYFIIAVAFIAFSIFSYQKFLWQYLVNDHQVVTVSLKDRYFARAEKTFKVEVVKTAASLTKGLSGRQSLISSDDQQIDGLYFIFPKAEVQHFWMKEMQFDIDICWLDGQEIFACTRNALKPDEKQALEDLEIYYSPQKASSVLETLPAFISSEDLAKKLFLSFRQ